MAQETQGIAQLELDAVIGFNGKFLLTPFSTPNVVKTRALIYVQKTDFFSSLLTGVCNAIILEVGGGITVLQIAFTVERHVASLSWQRLHILTSLCSYTLKKTQSIVIINGLSLCDCSHGMDWYALFHQGTCLLALDSIQTENTWSILLDAQLFWRESQMTSRSSCMGTQTMYPVFQCPKVDHTLPLDRSTLWAFR